MDDERSMNYHTSQSHIHTCVLTVTEEIKKGLGISIIVLVDALIKTGIFAELGIGMGIST